MKRFLLLVLLAFVPAAFAGTITLLNCPKLGSFEFQGIQIGKVGNVVVTCPDPGAITNPDPVAPTPAPAPPAPKPTPAPAPAPTPANCAWPANGKLQPIFPGGSGNYAFDSFGYTNTGRQPGPDPGATGPANSIQIFKLPGAFLDGTLIQHGHLTFGDFVLVNNGGLYEVSISKCPGDFETYKQDPPLEANVYRCGLTYGPNFSMGWATGTPAFFNECQVPVGEQWYLNWRVHGCPTDTGHTCGNVFTIPRG
jgi:hypothetical protein